MECDWCELPISSLLIGLICMKCDKVYCLSCWSKHFDDIVQPPYEDEQCRWCNHPLDIENK
jgi:hypothetical protein